MGRATGPDRPGCRSDDDERFMREALAEARLAADEGEVPVGAVVVFGGEVVARGRNAREAAADPSAHAEFTAMVAAARELGRWRLSGCTVYVTLEPCCMCAGLMVNARVGRCVFGAADPRAGALGSVLSLGDDPHLNHSFEVEGGVLADECARLLTDFFARARARGGDAADRRDRARHELDAELACALDGGQAPAPAAGRPPRVLLAIDSFKGSATSVEVESWAAEGVLRARPDARVAMVPLADGGEGTVAALRSALGGELVTRRVRGPFGDPVEAAYLLADNGDGPVAVVEMAQAAGLHLSPRTHGAALAASTFGVGELVLDAVSRGARRVYLALGGSATSDGGAGFLRALGARVLDADGADVRPGLAGLADVVRVDLRGALDALSGCELAALSDVDNPLVGSRGALRVFGAQKGLFADGGAPESIGDLDGWMVAYGRALDAARGDAGEALPAGGRAFRSVLGVPGAGAAGGLGAALLALGGRMLPGASTVLDLVGFDDALADADLLITGEGFMDEQTARGKAPVGAASRARRRGVKVVALVGGRADDLDDVYAAGVDLVLPICRRPMPLERALSRGETHKNLVAAGEAAVRAFLM